MKPSSLPFKKVVSLQTYSCIVLAFLTVILSLIGIVRVEPIYVFEDYFGEQKAEDRVSDAVMEDFSIGMIDVIVGIPQLVEAIRFDGGEFSEPEAFGNRIGKYLDSDEPSVKRDLTMYVYLTFSAFDESFFVGLLLLIQLLLVICLPILSAVCASIVTARFLNDGKRDYFAAYKDSERGIKPIVSAVLFCIAVISLLPNLALSVSGILLTVTLAAFTAFNFACMRLRDHTYAQRKYLTVLQIGSLVNLALTAVYFVGLVISDSVPKLIELCELDTWELVELIFRFEGEISLEFEEIFVVVLTAAFIFINISICKIASMNICRSFCNTQKKRYGNVIYADTFVGRAFLPVWGLLIIIFLWDGGDLTFKGSELTGFVVAAVSGLLMLLTEIAIKFLIGTVCIDLGKSGADNVLRGDVYDRRDEEV